jgi:thioredoxin-related protein
MNKKLASLFFVAMIFFLSNNISAQAKAALLNTAPSHVDTTKLYNPKANAKEEISVAVAKAKKQGKHVLIQAGGNWCSWCLLFNKFTTEDAQIDSTIKANYIVYHLNYSPENINKEIFQKYGFAQRFGFPVFIVLDGDGNRIHTQNSAYLEEGKGYNKRKVLEFFNQWSPESLDPSNYKNY